MPGYLASRKYPVVYLNIPKSGCTTIKNYIYYLDNDNYYKSSLDIHKYSDKLFLTYNRNRGEIYRKFHNSILFTFVRHPLRRAYSAFLEKIVIESNYAFPAARKILKEEYGAKLATNSVIDDVRLDFIKFLYFVKDTLKDNSKFRKDYHWIPQSQIVNNALKYRSIDFIGRIEHFRRDFEYILNNIGYTGVLDFRTFNEGSSRRFSYEDILNDEIRTLGWSIFAADYNNFAYGD